MHIPNNITLSCAGLATERQATRILRQANVRDKRRTRRKRWRVPFWRVTEADYRFHGITDRPWRHPKLQE